MIKNDIEKSNIIEKIWNYFNISKKNTCKKPIEIYNNIKNFFQSEEQIINCYEDLISILSLYKKDLLSYLLNNVENNSGAIINIKYDSQIFEKIDKDELENLGEFSEDILKFHNKFTLIQEFNFKLTINQNFNFYEYLIKSLNQHSHLKINNQDENPFYIKYNIYYLDNNKKKIEINNSNEKQKILVLLLDNKEIYFGITYDLKDENYINYSSDEVLNDDEFFCLYTNIADNLKYEKKEDIIKNSFLKIYQKIINKNISCQNDTLSQILILISIIKLFYTINFKNKKENYKICKNLDDMIQSFTYNQRNQFFFTKLIDYSLFEIVQNNYLNQIFSFNTRYNLFKLKFDSRRTFINYIDFIKNSNKNINTIINNQRYKIQIERGKEYENYLKIFENTLNDNKSFTTIFNYNGYIEFDFNNEIGKGIGPTNEFYCNLFKSFMEKNLNLFIINHDNFLYPLPKFSNEKNEKDILLTFQFLGFIIARCILDDRLIDIPLSKTFIDLITNKPIVISDIQNINKEIYDFISKKEQFDNINNMNLYFIFPYKGNDIELIKNGKNILITNENINEYIINLYNFLFKSKEIKEIINSFKNGFNTIFPIERLNYLTSEEIQNIILTSQIEKWEEKEISKFIIIEHGYSINSKQISYFFKYISELRK